MTEEKLEEGESTQDSDDTDFLLDFTTSSAISRTSLKFLAFYIPILWFSGMTVMIYAYDLTRNKPPITEDWVEWIGFLILLPIHLFLMFFFLMASVVFFTKLFLILANLVHKPKEGVFLAEKGNKDYEFWCLRIELKKLGLWITRNFPLPWIDIFAFRWFGVKVDFSSHMNDAWCDGEFVRFGRKVMVGQGAIIMSSMVVGKYLIIKSVVFDDYVVVGGVADIAPGTIIGKDSVIGAVSTTNFNQLIPDGMIYFGIPAIKLKENKYHEARKDIIRKVDVDDAKSVEKKYDANIDEDKKDQIKSKKVD